MKFAPLLRSSLVEVSECAVRPVAHGGFALTRDSAKQAAQQLAFVLVERAQDGLLTGVKDGGHALRDRRARGGERKPQRPAVDRTTPARNQILLLQHRNEARDMAAIPAKASRQVRTGDRGRAGQTEQDARLRGRNAKRVPFGDGLVILKHLGFAPPIYMHWGTAVYMAIVAAFLYGKVGYGTSQPNGAVS